MNHSEMLSLIDHMADNLGLEYAEEFSDEDIYYELYRSDDGNLICRCDTLEDLLQTLLKMTQAVKR